MKRKVKRVSKRTLAYFLSVLMILQAIYLPSLMVYADDVVAPSIGGDTSYLLSNFQMKKIDITFLCENDKNYMVFESSTGERQQVELPSGEDYNSPIDPLSQAEALGVRVKWAVSHPYDSTGTTSYSKMSIKYGCLYEESTNATKNGAVASEIYSHWEFSTTDSNSEYQLRYYCINPDQPARKVSYVGSENEPVSVNWTNKRGSRESYNTPASMVIQKIRLILTDKKQVAMSDHDISIEVTPSVVKNSTDGITNPSVHVVDTKNNAILRENIDYDIRYGNTVPGRNYIDIIGRGLENNSMYISKQRVYFEIVPGTPQVTAAPQGKALTWNGNAQELVTAGTSDVGFISYSTDGVNFSRSIPTATEPGTYKIWYRVDLNSGDYQWWEPLTDHSFVVTSAIKYPVHTVSFVNDDGASSTPSQSIEHFQRASQPENPTRQGFIFRGWYTSDGTIYNFGSQVLEDVQLHAKWATKYIDETGVEQTLDPDGYHFVTAGKGDTQSDTITWSDGIYTAGSEMTVNGGNFDHAIEVTGNVKLILPDGVTLNVPKGIHVNQGAALSIYGQEKGTGKLIAKGSNSILANDGYDKTTAGIGGIYKRFYNAETYVYEDYGTINIYGGNIEAQGSSDFPTAGIGGGANGTVNIYGGHVMATGSNIRPGISGFAVNITGGTVTANGGPDTSIATNGIYGTNLSITGGNVTALGADSYGIYCTSAITLAWTKYSDSITSNGIYVQGSHENNGKYFYLNDTTTPAEWTAISNSQQYSIGGSSESFTLKPAGDKTVTFHMNNGKEEDDSFHVAYQAAIPEPAEPTRDGCIFDGWYVNDEKCTFPYTVSEDIILTAKWKVPYLKADGSTASINAETVTDITENTSSLTEGWYQVTGNIEISNHITASGNVNIILCDGAALHITNENGISGNDVNLTVYTQTDGENAGSMTVSNVSFTGSGAVTVNGGNITGNLSSSSQVNINSGNINAESINGNPINIRLTNRNDSVTVGSYYGSVTLNGTYARTNTDENELAYAYWNSPSDNNINGAILTRSNSCTVTFDTQGGSSVANQTIVEGMSISQPENPTKNKAVFDGWLLNGKEYDFDTVYNTFTENNNTITLTAKWIPFAEYLDENHLLVEKADAEELSSDSFVWGEWGQETWYAVNETVSIKQRVAVHGNVNLILRDGATLNALEGIEVYKPASLTIYGASTNENTMGVLNASGSLMYYDADSYMAGIGGYVNGTVTINGGKINATGGKGGPGIGGHYHYGDIMINGGIVNATGNNGGAGIGGTPDNTSYSDETGTITINGGTVIATGSGYITETHDYIGGAGIGGSASQASGIITINGGTIIANGSYSSSDIGCGSLSWNNVTDNDIVIINGGNITANGTSSSFGMGSCNGGGKAIPVSLSWNKDENTRIYAKSYHANISLDREYLFQFDGEDSTAVTADNISGQTIVPNKYVSIPKYTVNFYKNIPDIAEKELYTSQEVYEGDTAEYPSMEADQYITYDGDDDEYHYQFIGWKDADGNTFTSDTKIIKDTDLYADWTYIKDGTEHYLVKVIADQGSAINITMQDSSGSYENSYESGGYESGYESGGYESGYESGGYESGYESGGYESGYESDGYESGYESDSSGGNENENENKEYAYVSNGVWSAWLPVNTEVTLTVTPADGYSITKTFAKGIELVTEEAENTYSFTISDSHVTVQAESEIQKFTVTWKNGDTVLETDENTEYGTIPKFNGTVPEAPEGYHFKGWTPEISVVTGDVAYTAVYSDQYTVTFNDGDDNIWTGEYKENSLITPYSLQPKDGYRLAGWLDANGNLFDFATPVTKDITLTAKWIENIVNIQFIDVNGKAKTTLKIYPVNNSFENTAQQIVIPNVPYLDGYTFTGWTLNGTSYSKDSQSNLEAALASLVETAPDDAIIVKEIYTQAETLYSVTVTGGSVRNSKDDTSGKYQASDQIYVTATGNTEGQIFSHWEKLDAGSTTPVIVGYEETYAFRMPSKDTSLTAVYQTTPEEKVGTAYIESVTVHDESDILPHL